MIAAFRRSRLLLVTAVVALLSAIPMAALPLLHGGDDPACDPRAAEQGSSAHDVNGGGTAPAKAQHCIVCHWSKWVRAIPDDAPAVTLSVNSGPVAAVRVAQPRTTTASRSFARAPPVS
jgi:hypothetical protein